MGATCGRLGGLNIRKSVNYALPLQNTNKHNELNKGTSFLLYSTKTAFMGGGLKF